MSNLTTEIQKLKKEKDFTILAHYYQEGAIQDVADFVGDSFYLAKMGEKVKTKNILLAGVVFMGESVKILNPDKNVFVPDLGASCSLVEGAPFDQYLQWRQQHDDALCVTYINSSAEVKSISDVIITSSNAAQIVDSIPKNRRILFGPDQHLGKWLSKKLNREFIYWNGACQVHILFNAGRLAALIKEHPEALVIAHPECEDEILKYAQVIGSTSKLLQEVTENKKVQKFIVATETGIFHQMQKSRPDAILIQAPVVDETCNCNDCPFMKMNSLDKIMHVMKFGQNEIRLDETLRQKAFTSLDRMMKLTSADPNIRASVHWPEKFLYP